MKITLTVASGTHAGKSIPVAGPNFLIGRDPDCQLRPASPAISKKHCAIVVKNGAVFVADFGSTNGTFVNGEQVSGERPVGDGDTLVVGPLEFTVRVDVRTATPTPSNLRPVSPAASNLKAAVKAPTPPGASPSPIPGPKPMTRSDDVDDAASMLLTMDDEEGVPEGSTAVGMPAISDADLEKAKEEAKKKPAAAGAGDSAIAAADLLRKYSKRGK